MGIIKFLRGPQCDLCGRRNSSVCKRARLGGTFCDSCAKAYRQGGGSTNKNINRKRK